MSDCRSRGGKFDPPSPMWLGEQVHLAMTIAVDWDVKQQYKQTNSSKTLKYSFSYTVTLYTQWLANLGIKLGGDLGEIVAIGAEISP